MLMTGTGMATGYSLAEMTKAEMLIERRRQALAEAKKRPPSQT
jgi:hypothetical protein